jgi:hypothetical protein
MQQVQDLNLQMRAGAASQVEVHLLLLSLLPHPLPMMYATQAAH